MQRRGFIAGLAGAAAWPLAAHAQQPKRPARIGFLGLSSASEPALNNFRAGLRDLGYVEGRNLQIESRFAAGDEDRLPALAAELAALNVDVIVTYGTGNEAARHATTTIPIVTVGGPDVVALGWVRSLARPGGNFTGLTFFLPELMAQRLEILKEMVPPLTDAAVLLSRGAAANQNILQVMEATAKEL